MTEEPSLCKGDGLSFYHLLSLSVPNRLDVSLTI